MMEKIRDNRKSNWYWIDREVYTKFAKKIGPIGLAIYNAYAYYAFQEQKVFPAQNTIAENLGITRRTVLKYTALLEEVGLIRVENCDGFVNIITLLKVPCDTEENAPDDEGVNEVHRGCETDSQGGVNKVHTIKTNMIKTKLYKRESARAPNDKRRFLDNIFLTEEEHGKLVEKLGRKTTDEYIEALNDGIGSKGYKYKSHYYTILNWYRRDEGKKPKKPVIDMSKFRQEVSL